VFTGKDGVTAIAVALAVITATARKSFSGS
jgi:hypothetical protein